MQPLIDKFVEKVINYGVYSSMDYSYVKNRVLALVGEEGIDTFTKEEDIKSLKDSLVEIAEKNGKVNTTVEEKDCLGAELMNFITPIPSLMNEIFWNSYKVSPQKAIENFYQISKDNDYIKLSAISKNIAFQAETKYGNLEITINLSKPEKDPKTIAAEKLLKPSNYPKCMENEGYQGRVNYPARANHRIIRMNLGEELWGFQYSPYSYFNEHAIFFNSEHVPMAITPKTFEQLLDIIDKYGNRYELKKIMGEQSFILDQDENDVGISIDSLINNPLYFGQKDLSDTESGYELNLLKKIVGSKISEEQNSMENIILDLDNSIRELFQLELIPEKIEELNRYLSNINMLNNSKIQFL